MKTFIFYSIIPFALLGFSLSNSNVRLYMKKSHVALSTDIYQIYNIDSVKNVYLIYVRKNKNIYKVVSEKSSCNRSKISTGKYYKMKLISLFPDNYPQKPDIAGVMYNGVTIEVEKSDSILPDVFVTKNLNGLCFIK